MIGGGELDPVFEQAELQRFARNLGGLYHLWPSASFGPWLNTGSGFVGAGAIGSQIEVFDGQPDAARAGPLAARLDARRRSAASATSTGRCVAGAATPTPVSLTLTPGTGADLEALVAFDDGDGTVPLRSASLGTMPGGGTDAGRAAAGRAGVRRRHVPMPNDAGVQARLLPWLRTARSVADDRSLPGGRLARRGPRRGPAGRARPRAAAAARAGPRRPRAGRRRRRVRLRRRPQHRGRPGGQLTVPLEAPGATLELTPLSGATRGADEDVPGARPPGVRELKPRRRRRRADARRPGRDERSRPGGPAPAGGGPGPAATAARPAAARARRGSRPTASRRARRSSSSASGAGASG